jgi:hypothetical protein
MTQEKLSFQQSTTQQNVFRNFRKLRFRGNSSMTSGKYGLKKKSSRSKAIFRYSYMIYIFGIRLEKLRLRKNQDSHYSEKDSNQALSELKHKR